MLFQMFQIASWAETWKAHEPKMRLWHGTDSNKVAEERIDFAGLWCCRGRQDTVENWYALLH